jgi:hypothetical protein
MTTHTIPFGKLSVLVEKLADLNKRGERLGLPPLGVDACEFWERVHRNNDPLELGPRVIKRFYSITFVGDAPRYKGHSFVAVLEHHDAGNIIARSPWAAGEELTAWQQASSRCQHCGLARRRKQTVLVRTPDGGLIQLGTDCMVDYLGTTDAAEAVRLWALWAELQSSFSDEDGGFWGGGAPEIATVDYVAAAVCSVRRRGYHKAGSDVTTRSDVDFAMAGCPADNGRRGDREMIQAWKDAQPTDTDRARAAAAMAWASHSRDNSDYASNLRVALSEPVVGKRSAGLLASLPAAFDRHEGVERERREAPKPAGHFGAVGERTERLMTLETRAAYESDFGTGVMLILRDEQNHLFQTFTSGEAQRIEDWSGVWAIRGTVKKHATDRRGRPVTVLARCTVERVLTQGEHEEHVAA